MFSLILQLVADIKYLLFWIKKKKKNNQALKTIDFQELVTCAIC